MYVQGSFSVELDLWLRVILLQYVELLNADHSAPYPVFCVGNSLAHHAGSRSNWLSFESRVTYSPSLHGTCGGRGHLHTDWGHLRASEQQR
jgi:hypothetical protein